MGSFNIDAYKNLVNGNNNNGFSYTSNTTLNGNSFGYGGGNTLNSIFNGIMGIAQMAVCYAVQPGTSGGGTISQKDINTAITTTIATTTQKIAEKSMAFDSKYSQFGITMNTETGEPQGKTFEQALADIDKKISEYKDLSKNSNGNTLDNVKAYNTAKSEYEGLCTNLTKATQLTSDLNSMSESEIKITGTKGEKSSSAEAQEPNATEFKQFCSEGQSPESTQAYQNAKLKNELAAKTYNQKVAQLNIALGNNDTIEALKQEVETKKTAMEEAGKKVINDGSSTTCAQYDNALQGLYETKASLGTKAEFDKSIQDVKDLINTLNDAKLVQKEQAEATEADNSIKYAKENGKWKGKDNKDNRNTLKENKTRESNEAQQAALAFMKKYFS